MLTKIWNKKQKNKAKLSILKSLWYYYYSLIIII